MSPLRRAIARARCRVVVVPTDEDVDRFCIDARFFMAALEGASAAALEDTVKPFPSLQIDPYRNLAPHFGVASARAAALHALATGTRAGRRRVGGGAPAAAEPAGPPEPRPSSSEPGMDLDPVALGDLLADAGFTREDPVDEHGEFCVRGGIVDCFPAGADNPIRVEFVGDTIESIRRYDPATQRSVGTLDQASVVPLTEKSGLRQRSSTTCLPVATCRSSSSKKKRRAARPEADRAAAAELSKRPKTRTRRRRRRRIC